MPENHAFKLTPVGQIVLIAGVVIGLTIATAVRTQMGFTGALWGGLFGALGGGIGAAVALPIAGLFKQKQYVKPVAPSTPPQAPPVTTGVTRAASVDGGAIPIRLLSATLYSSPAPIFLSALSRVSSVSWFFPAPASLPAGVDIPVTPCQGFIRGCSARPPRPPLPAARLGGRTARRSTPATLSSAVRRDGTSLLPPRLR